MIGFWCLLLLSITIIIIISTAISPVITSGHHHHNYILNYRPSNTLIFTVLVVMLTCTMTPVVRTTSTDDHQQQTSNSNQNVCLIKPSLGYSDPKNVYQCRVPLKCCFEYQKPSCCGSKPSWQIIQEQFALWGGLFAILGTIASVVYCRKNDINMPACVAFRGCLVQCCCGQHTATDKDTDIAVNSTENKLEDHGNQNNHDNYTNKIDSNNRMANHRSNPNTTSKHHHGGWRNNAVNPINNSNNSTIMMSSNV